MTSRASDLPRNWSSVARVIRATPHALYECFIDPEILLSWLPPAEMTGRIHEFDARAGGGYRMSLYYPSTELHFRGKTAEREDQVSVRFLELSPPGRIVESVNFVSEDPDLAGEMGLTITLERAASGTEVTMLFTSLPPGLRAEDNDAGARLSLAQLARRFEGA